MTNTTNDPHFVQRAGPANAWAGARIANLILGIWLFISAFIWPHTPASRTNTWIIGALIAICSAVASSVPQVRWVNTLLAVWLFIATLGIHHVSSGTVWNNLIVAVVVFVLSLVPSRGRTPLR